jgi:hypothetical protein
MKNQLSLKVRIFRHSRNSFISEIGRFQNPDINCSSQVISSWKCHDGQFRVEKVMRQQGHKEKGWAVLSQFISFLPESEASKVARTSSSIKTS